MIRPIQTNLGPKAPQATVEQTHALAGMYVANGYSPEQAMKHLKEVKYTIDGVHYKATYIANYIAGARAIVGLVQTGLATVTKAKGLVIK